jgi:hypothetical protein
MTDLTTATRISIGLALVGSLSHAALALTHTGGAYIGDAASVKLYDATNPTRPILTEQTEALTQSGPFVSSHDALFVAAGREVRQYDRRDLSLPARASWSAPSAVLAVADGPERGLVLVLDAAALTLVRFSDTTAPVALWSTAIDSSALGANPGRLVVRDGSRAYVADASIPGLRVVSVDPAQAPATIATYASPDGTIHDLTLWGGRLTLAADTGLVVVDVAAGDQPELHRLGAYPTHGAAERVDANSRYALVADGSTVSVVDIDPASAGFMANAVDGWQAPADIRAVRLDKENRAYVLVGGAYEILDVAAYGGR